MDWFLYDNGLRHERVKRWKIYAPFYGNSSLAPRNGTLMRQATSNQVLRLFVRFLSLSKSGRFSQHVATRFLNTRPLDLQFSTVPNRASLLFTIQ